MAAIYDPDGTLDLNKLFVDIKELPSYARPQFIRILTKIDLTGICLCIDTSEFCLLKFINHAKFNQ